MKPERSVVAPAPEIVTLQHPITQLICQNSGALRHMNAVFRMLPDGRTKYAQQYAFLADDIAQLPPFDLSAHEMRTIWNENINVYAPTPSDDFNDSRHPWYVLARIIGITHIIGDHDVDTRCRFMQEVLRRYDEVDMSRVDYDPHMVSDRVAELLSSFNDLKSMTEQPSLMPLQDIVETWANGITPLVMRFDLSNTFHRS